MKTSLPPKSLGSLPLLFLPALFCFLPSASAAEPEVDEGILYFETTVRPILQDRCADCHSAENETTEGELSLDGRASMLAGGGSGPVLVPNKPSESLLIKAVEYLDPDLQMPPDSKLPDKEIAILKKWIEMGAPAPEGTVAGAEEFDIEGRREAHWAWHGVKRPELPAVNNSDWASDDLDRFILAKLEASKLKPAVEVDRRVWLRRVTFDITGLPPTKKEIEAFLADESPEAYERVVDRLLANPAFGEAWGQYWLDLVRYAETKGHEGDYSLPNAWRYRDYVIRALNANVPYDQFVREHIAGDQIESPRLDPETKSNESIIGTAFWHLGEATHAPVDIRGEEADRVDNQLDVFGKTFMGLTIACSRCHDHKFDAISQADYYALCGILQSSRYRQVDVSNKQVREKLREELTKLNARYASKLLESYARAAEPQLDELARNLVAASPAADRLQVTAEAKDAAEPEKKTFASEMIAARASSLHPLHELAQALDRAASQEPNQAPVAKAKLKPVVNFSGMASPSRYEWLVTGVSLGDSPLAAGQLTLQSDRVNLPVRVVEHACATPNASSWKLHGTYSTPTFEVTGKKLWYGYRGKADVFLDVDSHRTIHGPLHTEVEQKLDSPQEIAWFEHPVEAYLGHRVHVDFTPKGNFELFAVGFADTKPGRPEELQPLELASAADKKNVNAADLSAEIAGMFRDALTHAVDGNATPQDAALVNWMIDNTELLAPLSKEDQQALDKLTSQWEKDRKALEKKIPRAEFVPVLVDGSPEVEYVHLRGNHKRLAADPTPRRFLEALGADLNIGEGSGRKELAERVASADNPLTARVWANRIWQHLLGQGIVPSVDNFGVLGEKPTHPELLDYLADELVASGWDTKAMIRRVVLSSTYRQSTQVSEEGTEVDPANELLHHARVRRIPAESIRDSLLMISGKLSDERFGRSVPIHITDFMRHNRSPNWSGPMDGRGRRSIYVEVRRNALSHFLTAFDRPPPATTVGQRNLSNSASQPLILLNDPLVHRLTKRWARHLARDHEDDAVALDEAFLASLGRLPTAEEKQQILPYIQERTESESRRAAWNDVCLTLVNMKEFIFLQ